MRALFEPNMSSLLVLRAIPLTFNKPKRQNQFIYSSATLRDKYYQKNFLTENLLYTESYLHFS